MADTTPTTTAQKSWWEAAAEALGGFVKDGAQAYKDYTAGHLNDKVADQVKKSQPVDWNKIAKTAGIVLAIAAGVGIVVWFLGRNRN